MIRTTSLHVLALSVQSEDKIQIPRWIVARTQATLPGWMDVVGAVFRLTVLPGASRRS